MILHGQVLVNDIIDLQFPICHLFIEVGNFLKAKLLNQVTHGTLVIVDLAIAKSTLKHLLGIESILYLCLLQSKTDFRLRLSRFDDV